MTGTGASGEMPNLRLRLRDVWLCATHNGSHPGASDMEERSEMRRLGETEMALTRAVWGAGVAWKGALTTTLAFCPAGRGDKAREFSKALPGKKSLSIGFCRLQGMAVKAEASGRASAGGLPAIKVTTGLLCGWVSIRGLSTVVVGTCGRLTVVVDAVKSSALATWDEARPQVISRAPGAQSLITKTSQEETSRVVE